MLHSDCNISHSDLQNVIYDTASLDAGKFFQEATQRLCGTLDMEKAFGSFFEYIHDTIGATSFTVGRISFERNTAETMLICDDDGVTLSRRRQQLPPAVIHEADVALRRYVDAIDGIYASSLADPTAHFLCKMSTRGIQPPLFFLRIQSGDDFWVGVTMTCTKEAPFTPAQLDLIRGLRAPLLMALTNCVRFQELELLKEYFAKENLSLRRRIGRAPDAEIVGSKGSLAPLVREAQLVAATDVPVLVQGETGAGKEVIANAVHSFSRRAGAPFIAVNCGAIPASLIDSELFGHAKGAFTGAIAEHKGYFEQAQGGTLFLDEIGELPLDVQARLLRVLQDGSVNRVGGSALVTVDFRLIAATHRDLRVLVSEGRFREDLYYRLRVVQLKVPPLRERASDIPMLATHFLQRAAARFGVTPPAITHDEMQRLIAYSWPGNVRELRNVLEEALVLAPQGPLRFRLGEEDFRGMLASVSADSGGLARLTPQANAPLPSLDELHSQYFRALLQSCHGQINGPGGAAEKAGLNGSTLRFRLRKLGIEFGRTAPHS